jgi:stage II sporulation protein AB (anti-sigma F factor)
MNKRIDANVKEKRKSGRPPEKLKNEMRFELPALSINEGIARAVAAVFISQLDPTYEELSDLKCAVSEAVTNVIVHAYKNKTGYIYITMKISGERTIRIEVRDKGCGIEDIKAAMQPLYTTDPDGERSGMGFTVMENFTDRLYVISHPGRGTKVTMIKTLSDTRNVKGGD